MPWQDWVFFLGGLIILVSLVPTIRGAQKPALATSAMSTVLICVFTFTMASMGLWLSALTNGLIAGAWGILAVQRYRQGNENAQVREDLLDVSAGSEGS